MQGIYVNLFSNRIVTVFVVKRVDRKFNGVNIKAADFMDCAWV